MWLITDLLCCTILARYARQHCNTLVNFVMLHKKKNEFMKGRLMCVSENCPNLFGVTNGSQGSNLSWFTSHCQWWSQTEGKKKKELTSQTYPMRCEHREKEKGSVYHSELERLRAYVIMEECIAGVFLHWTTVRSGLSRELLNCKTAEFT